MTSQEKYAHFFDSETFAVHRIPREKFNQIQRETKKEIEIGIHDDIASNNMRHKLIKFPVVLYIDWAEREL